MSFLLFLWSPHLSCAQDPGDGYGITASTQASTPLTTTQATSDKEIFLRSVASVVSNDSAKMTPLATEQGSAIRLITPQTGKSVSQIKNAALAIESATIFIDESSFPPMAGRNHIIFGGVEKLPSSVDAMSICTMALKLSPLNNLVTIDSTPKGLHIDPLGLLNASDLSKVLRVSPLGQSRVKSIFVCSLYQENGGLFLEAFGQWPFQYVTKETLSALNNFSQPLQIDPDKSNQLSYDQNTPPGASRPVTITLPPSEYIDDAVKCAKELGFNLDAFPRVLNCMDPAAKFLSTTINGDPVTWSNIIDSLQYCDFAHWLSGTCHTYTFLQDLKRFISNPDVNGFLNCRQNDSTTGESRQSPDDLLKRIEWYEKKGPSLLNVYGQPSGSNLLNYKYITQIHDAAMIFSNKKTGKTCFFQTLNEDLNGSAIPFLRKSMAVTKTELPKNIPQPPDSDISEWWSNKTASPWYGAGTRSDCQHCHDNDPWMRSPWILQNGDPLPTFPLDRPYLIVTDTGPDTNLREIRSTDPVDVIHGGTHFKESLNCVGCHRIAGGINAEGIFYETPRHWIESSLGHKPERSSKSNTMPEEYWMPLGHGLKSIDAWMDKYADHARMTYCCSRNPDNLGCDSRPLATGFKTMPDGSLELSDDWKVGNGERCCSAEAFRQAGIGKDDIFVPIVEYGVSRKLCVTPTPATGTPTAIPTATNTPTLAPPPLETPTSTPTPSPTPTLEADVTPTPTATPQSGQDKCRSRNLQQGCCPTGYCLVGADEVRGGFPEGWTCANYKTPESICSDHFSQTYINGGTYWANSPAGTCPVGPFRLARCEDAVRIVTCSAVSCSKIGY